MFPTEEKLTAFFAPAKWAACLKKADNCLLMPEVTLSMVDDIYGSEDWAKQVVYNNLIGIYQLAEPKTNIDESAVDMTAGLLVARYGNDLSIFALLYYFASYLTEYKDSYGRFDLQDVLRQLGRNFIPWWRGRIARMEQEKKKDDQDDDKPRGKEALIGYLRREYIQKGKSIRESACIRYLTEDEIKALEREKS